MMVKNLYIVWIKIDETLPWVELKGVYQTAEEARRAAKQSLKNTKIKIVEESERRSMKALAPLRTTH